jgi:hypothetical protein
MKKFLVILMLATLTVAGIAANRTGAIRAGFTMLSQPMTFSASDTLKTSETYTITITNIQKYLQHQTFTTTITAISGSPSVLVTAYGKVTSGGSWVQIGTPVTWTTSGNNPIEITSATPLNYNYLKVAYVCSGATQKVKVTSFDVRTANVFDIGSASAYVLGVAGGTMSIVSSDWTIGTTGNMANIGTIGANGLFTGTGGATITGAAVNLNASSNFATNINTGTTNAALSLGGGSGTVAVNSTSWDISTTGVATGFTGLTSSGVIAADGGYTIPNASPVIWSKGGSTVLATSGTDVACANGTRFWVEVDIPYNVTLTGLAYLVGSVGGTDSVVVQLCNSAGVEVATSRPVGTAADLVGTAAQFQSVAFSTTYAAVAGKYYAAVQFNGTTAKFRAYPIPGSKFIANTAAGTWGTKADITPGTSFVADKGPILMTY